MQLTAHFVGGEPSPCTDEVGTWMDAIAVLYRNTQGQVQKLIAAIDQSKDLQTEDVWTVSVNGQTIKLPSVRKNSCSRGISIDFGCPFCPR